MRGAGQQLGKRADCRRSPGNGPCVASAASRATCGVASWSGDLPAFAREPSRQSLGGEAEAEAEQPAHAALPSTRFARRDRDRRRTRREGAGSADGAKPRQRPGCHGAHQRRSVLEQRLDRGKSVASPELPAAISALRMKRSRPVRLTGVPAKRARKAASSSASSSASGGSRCSARRRAASRARPRRTCSTGRRPGSRRSRRCGCPSRARNSRGDVALVLDGQVGDAAARIELVGRGEGIGRADVEAAAAAAAMVGLGRVGLELARGEDRAEEQPRAELARDEVGVLALPAEPGALRRAASPSAARCRRTP